VDLNPTVLRLVDWCNTKRFPLLLGGDANAHSSLWEDKSNDARGAEYEELIFGFDLDLHNEGRRPTFVGHQGQTIIDLTLSNQWFPGVTNWTTGRRVTYSDHEYMNFTVALNFIPELKKFQNLKKADWTRFRSILEGIPVPPIPQTCDELDEQIGRAHV
jgi:hypothetical protein